MSGNVFLDALFWFFAINGIFSILIDISNFFYSYVKANKDTDKRIILTVKNSQKDIEALIRQVVWQSLHNKNAGFVPDIYVVDLGCDEETQKALYRICNDYDFIHLTDKEGYINLIRKMS